MSPFYLSARIIRSSRLFFHWTYKTIYLFNTYQIKPSIIVVHCWTFYIHIYFLNKYFFTHCRWLIKGSIFNFDGLLLYKNKPWPTDNAHISTCVSFFSNSGTFITWINSYLYMYFAYLTAITFTSIFSLLHEINNGSFWNIAIGIFSSL